jgi:uncharacterized membrane protein
MLKSLKKDLKLLILLSLWCVTLALLRVFITGSTAFLFMIYNLFLAWIALFLSYYLGNFLKSKSTNRILLAGIFVPWLLFLPNTFYILTDLFHLQSHQIKNLPWFNLILLLTFSLNGLFLGITSLKLVSNSLAGYLSRSKIILFEIGVLLLSSYGVYLGRYLRWNSWDILVNPVGLFVGSSQALFSPSALGMIITFFVMIWFCYYFYTDGRRE